MFMKVQQQQQLENIHLMVFDFGSHDIHGFRNVLTDHGHRNVQLLGNILVRAFFETAQQKYLFAGGRHFFGNMKNFGVDLLGFKQAVGLHRGSLTEVGYCCGILFLDFLCPVGFKYLKLNRRSEIGGKGMFELDFFSPHIKIHKYILNDFFCYGQRARAFARGIDQWLPIAVIEFGKGSFIVLQLDQIHQFLIRKRGKFTISHGLYAKTKCKYAIIPERVTNINKLLIFGPECPGRLLLAYAFLDRYGH